MKKPEPWPRMTLWPPRCGAPSGMPGMPKRRKNSRSPGGISLLARPVVCPPSSFTRTDITAGLTLATMSAKPTGALSLCACSVRFCASASRIAGPVQARRDDERGGAEARQSLWRGGRCGGRTTRAAWSGGCSERKYARAHRGISIGSRKRGRALFQRSRWGDAPYSVLSRELNFSKVGKEIALEKSMS